jgi:hypothetical protein
MRRATFAGILLAAILGAALVYFVFLDSEAESPEALLARSQQVMESLSFSSRPECATCSDETRLQFASPDRLLMSGSGGSESWPFYLVIGEQAYVSIQGQRWLAVDDLQAALSRISDPRFLPAFTMGESIERMEQIDGRDATVVRAELDFDAFVAHVDLARFGQEMVDSARDAFAGVHPRFWVDSEDARLLKLEISLAEGMIVYHIDFSAPVDVPDSVESMPSEQAFRLNYEASVAGEQIRQAIGRFEQVNGTYPSQVNEAALAEVLDGPWPINPFSGRPMQTAADSPGDFDYILKAGGNHVEFRVFGWDDLAFFYDTERDGPIHVR